MWHFSRIQEVITTSELFSYLESKIVSTTWLFQGKQNHRRLFNRIEYSSGHSKGVCLVANTTGSKVHKVSLFGLPSDLNRLFCLSQRRFSQLSVSFSAIKKFEGRYN